MCAIPDPVSDSSKIKTSIRIFVTFRNLQRFLSFQLKYVLYFIREKVPENLYRLTIMVIASNLHSRDLDLISSSSLTIKSLKVDSCSFSDWRSSLKKSRRICLFCSWARN